MKTNKKHIISNVEFGYTMQYFPIIIDHVSNFYESNKEVISDQVLKGIKIFLRMIGVKGKERNLDRDIKLMIEMETMSLYKNLEFIKTNIFEMIYKYVINHKNNLDQKLKHDIYERLFTLEKSKTN